MTNQTQTATTPTSAEDADDPACKADRKPKVWLITGSSRGFGRSLAEAVLEHGDHVVATARTPASLGDLKTRFGNRVATFQLDVSDSEQTRASVDAAIDTFGGLDVLVNNAGYAFMGAVEEMSQDDFRAQIDTNFWGVVNMSRAAVPFMRKQRKGHIIQFSSIGGRGAAPGLSAYCAAKFAVEGFSESLASETKPFGVHITIIEPGGFRTDWSGTSMECAESMADYVESVGALRDYIKTHAGAEPGDPKKAAKVVIDVANMNDPPLHLPLGNDAMLILRQLYGESLKELDRWSHLTTSTDFDGVSPLTKEHKIPSVWENA